MADAESDGKITARLESQRLFLYACQEHPEIRLLQTLRESVFNKLPQGDELHQLLSAWARSHHLDYPWVLREASHLYRRSVSVSTGEFYYATTFESLVPTVYVGAPFQPPPWVPLETLKGYRRRVTALFKGHLDAVIDEYKKSRRPLFTRRRKLSGKGAPTLQAEHYRWAAEHVCLRWGWKKIADKNPFALDAQVIREIVLKLLKKIQIRARARLKSKTTSAPSCV